jgi:uncharacterized protein
MHWDYAAILLFLGVIVPLVGKWRVDRMLRREDTTSLQRIRVYGSTVIFQWSLVAFILWRTRAHHLSLAALGVAVPKPYYAAVVGVALTALMLANQLVSLRLLGKRPEDLKGKLAQVALRIFPRTVSEQVLFFGVVVTVAICEEVMFRGFVQGLFQALSGYEAVAIVVSSIWFSAAHLYQGKRGLISTFVVGMLFATARAISSSLLPVVIAHFAIDLIAGYFFPGRLRLLLAQESVQSQSL